MLRPPLLLAAAHLLALSACATAPRERPLQPFESEQEWTEYQAWQRREGERLRRQAPPPHVIIEPPTLPPSLPREPEVPVQTSLSPVPVRAATTTVQPAAEADPGPLAQVHGDYLILLHRGRLFTVRIGGGALEPVSVVDAFGPYTDPLFVRYDEMLVSGDRVVLVSLGSVSSGDAQLDVFQLAPDGTVARRATYVMTSAGEHFNGQRRHASRLVGDRLVFYSALSPHHYQRQASSYDDFPRISGGRSTRVERSVPTRVYRPAAGSTGGDMHTVTSCTLAGEDLRCRSTALYGPSARFFYLSGTAVYLWTRHTDRYWDEDAVPRHVLYRLPFDGSAPSALGVAGRPVDAFSFHESADGHIDVLVRKDASGAGIWGAERRLALLRVPLAQLGDGSRAAGAAQYRPLPEGVGGQLRARFVGDWLVYGSGAFTAMGQPGPDRSTAYAVHVAGGEAAQIALPHSIDRIEPMGAGAVILGGKGPDLHVTTLRLDSAGAVAAAHHRIPGPAEGWRLARGAFTGDAGGGVLALPMQEPARPGAPFPIVGSARIALLRDEGSRLEPLGEVAAGEPDRDDGCLAECGPWFGNARPLFAGGRILALMGYELVEARVADGRLRVVRRVEFTPLAPIETLAGDWEFTERLGPEVGPYRCRNRGTLWLDRDGQALTLRYRQTGECTVNGVTTPSDGEGSGTGTVSGNQFTLSVNGCTYHGRMRSADAFTTFVTCPVTEPGSARWNVEGSLEARRAQP